MAPLLRATIDYLKQHRRQLIYGALIGFPLWLLTAMAEDRLISIANSFADNHVYWLGVVGRFIAEHPLVIPVAILLAIIIHAYIHEWTDNPVYEVPSNAPAPVRVVKEVSSGPQIVALRYANNPEFFRGLYIRNDGEPAFNVFIPSIRLGVALAKFSHLGELTNFSKSDGEAYFDVWIEESGNPDRAGALFEAMRESGVEAADIAIHYDDFDGHGYVTSATLEIDVLARGGIVVRHKGRNAAKAAVTPSPDKQSSTINTRVEWKELAAKFERADRFVRADWARCINLRTNEVVYDQWDIKAGHDNAAVQALCAYAGRLLPNSQRLRDLLTDEIKQESNPAWRWLRFLKQNYRAMDQERFPAHGVNEQRERVERYYLGSISEVAVRSAVACIDCAGREL